MGRLVDLMAAEPDQAELEMPAASEATAAERLEAQVRAGVAGLRCAACDGHKRPGLDFCSGCQDALPDGLRFALFKPGPRGHGARWLEALRELRGE